MKSHHLVVLSVAVVALLGGCGKSSTPTNVETPVMDSSAPAVPEGLTVVTQPTIPGGHLRWNASSSPNVVAYEVFQFAPDPSRENSYELVTMLEDGSTDWTLPAVTTTTTKHFRIRAVDVNGNRSALTPAFQVMLLPGARLRDPGPGSQPFEG